jgi:chemotaxis protein methyltransferase CheR
MTRDMCDTRRLRDRTMREWSSPGIARIAALVRDRTGLVFPQARVADVESAVRRSMQRRGLGDTGEFAALLAHDARVRDAFVAELTIGETYFNRDTTQFDLLRSRLLPALLAASDRPVRVWSAGCASGEEPYSIAMLFDELEAPRRGDIVGTDIARPRLQDAQRAIYSKWSLRGMPDALRRRYFTERGRYFELKPAIRQRVDFRYLNLAEDQFPSLSVGIWGMDVILCRNVLIYFDTATVERVARRLIASLSEDGYLILGASDPAIGEMVECDVIVSDAGLVYRRAGAGGGAAGERAEPRASAEAALPPELARSSPSPESQPELSRSSPPPESPPELSRSSPPESPPRLPQAPLPNSPEEAWPRAPESMPEPTPSGAPAEPGVTARIAAAYDSRDFDGVRAAADRAAAAGQLGPEGWVYWLRSLANQGCLAEAQGVAAQAVQAGGPSAELLYLTAVLQLHGGRPQEAAAAARQALYLDRGLVVAHLTLAEAQRQLGNRDGARRSLRNASTLLASLPPETVIDASDGETAGRLAGLARFKLRLLEESA